MNVNALIPQLPCRVPSRSNLLRTLCCDARDGGCTALFVTVLQVKWYERRVNLEVNTRWAAG